MPSILTALRDPFGLTRRCQIEMNKAKGYSSPLPEK
jgi:hypothetical protein